jgi:SAM-dependent methyltransferase
VAGLTEDEQLYMTEEISRLYKVMRRRHRKTQGSEYLADVVPRGSKNEKGIRNEDLTRLTFADGQFSVVMCFEVLEHVPNYRAALSELARVLQQGGQLVMSAPFNAHIQEHCVRAFVRADGSIEHMLEPEFHVDPLNPQGCLCFYHFGWALLDDLRSVGFSDAYVVRYASKELCYLGADPLMFMATKT